jgi:hypothetical protein
LPLVLALSGWPMEALSFEEVGPLTNHAPPGRDRVCDNEEHILRVLQSAMTCKRLARTAVSARSMVRVDPIAIPLRQR